MDAIREILSGISLLVAGYDSRRRYQVSKRGSVDDFEALAGDYKKVGEDLKRAIRNKYVESSNEYQSPR